ncbi:MAG: DUF4349 domain-containing protein [Gemmataceae bacterium]|nr:DUF4349 domain-containing protein [Gemmataceae bacterium]
MSNHAWAEENLAAYTMGGLSAQERGDLEAHLADCANCTAVLSDSLDVEKVMDDLFASARPDAGLEDRVLQSLRRKPARRANWLLFVGSAAAVLVFGLIGAIAQSLLEGGKLPGGPMAQNNLKLSTMSTGRSFFGLISDESASREEKESFKVTDIDPSPNAQEKNTNINYALDRIAEVSVPGTVVPNAVVGILNGEKSAPPTSIPAPGGFGKGGQGGAIEPSPQFGGYDPKGPGLNGSFYGKKGPAIETVRPLTRSVPLLDGIAKTYDRGGKGEGLEKLLQSEFDSDKKLAVDIGDKVRDKLKGKEIEEVTKALEFFNRDKREESKKDTGGKSKEEENGELKFLDGAKGKDLAEFYKNQGGEGKPGEGGRVQFAPTFVAPKLNWAVPGMMMGGGGGGVPGMMGGMPGFPGNPPAGPALTPTFAPPISPPLARVDPSKDTKGTKGYFDDLATGGKGDKSDLSDKLPDGGQKPGDGKPNTSESLGKKTAESSANQGAATKPLQEPKTLPPDEPKIGRMIIRTGDMEFETEVFDDALQVVSRLIADVKGGFIATVNSDKLPNGKARGSVVVRMPPTFLDKFIYDLRRELSKTSDLKSQRLGSLDVTKMFYDIDSRLRASRTLEDRLIQIIKTGKGTVKELVEAERELGVWRTKIEEMEGEIRYYNNQVSLSTLTIIFAEKELQAPTALVLTSSVNVRLEVDDVSKAHQDALRAAEEVKGRITRSDIKTHTAGQIESVLSVEVPPAKKDTFFLALSKLGIVSDHRENSSQRTEGGAGKPGVLKPRLEDVRFEIQMMNNANLKPKHSVHLTIATTDVNGNYGKLQDLIAKIKGQLRDSQINEADKLNTFATVDFNVPTTDKGTIDKLIEAFGETLSRTKTQATVGELTTDRKYGYSLNMIDYGSAKPRTVDDMHLATLDVPAKVKVLVEAVAAAKGHVRLAQVNEKDKRNITAQLFFIVATEEKAKFDTLLVSLASVLSKSTARTPASEIATEKKHGYSVQLQDFISVQPRTSEDLTVATQDVPAKVRTIVEAVRISKGYVLNTQINEQDKLNITAHISFAVDVEEKTTFEKLFETIGTVLSRTTLQAPPNAVTTEQKHGYTVQLRDIANVLPRQAANVTIAVPDVPAKYQQLLDAIFKIKGQISVSQLNEQDRNNINGSISFSIPSEQRESFDKVIDGMGMVISRTRSQAPNHQLSTERKFGYSLALRDFISVMPKHALSMTVAVQDVPAKYQQVLDAISKAKGQIRVNQLNEQDRNNVNAVVDFTIPTEEKATLDKLFEEFGQSLSRNNIQATANDISTDKKFGYTLNIRDLISVLPRKSIVLTVAANDVPAKYAAIQAAVADAKGHVIVSHLNEKDKLNVTFQFDFSIPIEAKNAIDKALVDIGPVLSRDNLQAAPQQVATDRKFGYSIIARDFANIPPRETYHLRLAALDVANAFNELKEKAVDLKAIVSIANVDEENKAKINATLNFDVAASDKAVIDKLLSKAGATMSRKVSQAQPNELATEVKVSYRLIIESTADVPPREKVELRVEVTDVDAIVTKLRKKVEVSRGRIVDSKNQQEPSGTMKAELVFDVPLNAQDLMVNEIKGLGVNGIKSVKSMTTHPRNNQVPDNENATARITLHLQSGSSIEPPREKVELRVEVTDVDAIVTKLREKVKVSGGRIVDSRNQQEPSGTMKTELVFDVPLSAQDLMVTEIKGLGANGVKSVKSIITHPRDNKVPDNEFATARITVHLQSASSIVPDDDTLWSPIRTGLYRAFALFSYCIMVVIIGLAGVLPWVLLFYGSYRIVKWTMRPAPPAATVELVPTTTPAPPKTDGAN